MAFRTTLLFLPYDNCIPQQRAYQMSTISSSSSAASCTDSFHSNSSSYADTLPPRNLRKESENTVLQPSVSMPVSNRSARRNVHIFDARDQSSSIGGLRVSNGVTYANFHAMIEIFVLFDGDYTLQNESGITVEKNESPLQPGNYYIVSLCKSS